jgi:hypothetical protein
MLILVASAVVASAQSVIIDQFNSSSEVSNFSYNNWNGSPGSVAFSSSDANNNPSSGSMQMNITYSPSENGCSFISSAAPMPLYLTNATYIEFDLMVDPSSPLDPNGNAYYFQIGFNSPSFTSIAQFWLGPYGTTFTPGVWQHFKLPVPAGITGSSSAFSQLYINPYNGSFTSSQTVVTYIDNIKIDVTPVGGPTYPNFAAFTFDAPISITSSNAASGPAGGTPDETTGIGWYGQPTLITWATNNSTITTNPSITQVSGSGSAHIVATFNDTAMALDNGDVIALALDTNYFGDGSFPGSEANTNDILNGNNYDAVEFDILWDTNLSTMSIDQFNSMGDITGIPMGLLEPVNDNPNSGVDLSASETAIPNTASNGWVHMVLPIPSSTAGLNQIIGLYFKKFGSGSNGVIDGTAAYYIDNVVFDGGPELPPSPVMSISKPVLGLNTTCNDGQYDRESLVTFNYNYTWVDQSGPVTYDMDIAQFPGVKYNGFDARLYLVPNSEATEADPDYQESSLAMISVYLNGTGQAAATIGCKANAANGNGDLYDSTNPIFTTTNSPVVGNWSFTFTHNTNILVTAPDGESTNLTLPLLTSSELESDFGSSAMVVYVGGYDNGSANIGQNMVFASVGITNGGAQLLYDDFLTDTQINQFLVDGGPWIEASTGSSPGIFLTSPTSKFNVDWTVPAAGFVLQTNANLLSNNGWSTNDPLTAVQLGDHFQATVDATNLPPSGPLYFRVNDNPTH